MVLYDHLRPDDVLQIRVTGSESYALVLNTGSTQRTEIAGDVSLYGFMPVSGMLYVDDLAEEYAGFAPIYQRNTVNLGAYDISLKSEDGEALEAKGIQKVTISNKAIAEALSAGKEVRLWMRQDDGVFTEVEYKKIDDNSITFYINRWTAYIVTCTIDSYTGSYEFSLAGDGFVLLADLLDSLGVEVQLIRHGKYKSAGEMYIRSSASPENREQYQRMID